MKYLINRLREPSSWAGFAALLATAAQAFSTKDPQAIAATVAGAVAMLTPDKAPAEKAE